MLLTILPSSLSRSLRVFSLSLLFSVLSSVIVCEITVGLCRTSSWICFFKNKIFQRLFTREFIFVQIPRQQGVV